MSVFTVDIHLFRELGDLLVGRDSTALFELIKNAYDADATEVFVVGTALDDPVNGVILVTDNGSGMNEDQFRRGFLRIASRMKETGQRRSEHFRRRYTGAKGIGRLAAHKLARALQVDSFHGTPGEPSSVGLHATIDWNAIEDKQTLDELRDEVTVRPECSNPPRPAGTRVTLQRLRRQWLPDERAKFVTECRSFQPPAVLASDLVPQMLPQPLLFVRPAQRLGSDSDPGFTVRLDGEFAAGDDLWPTVAATAEWVIEIDAPRPEPTGGAQVHFGIAPTAHLLRRRPGLSPGKLLLPHPRPLAGPFFQARILVQVKPKASPSERRLVRRESGVRVFVEGFRILPYGEPGNDWLALDADYTRRTSLDLGDAAERLFGPGEEDEHWESLTLPNRSYFGAVFLTQDDAAALRPLVNREGFLPDASFDCLRDTVRLGIDLCTRVRAAADYQTREAAREARRRRRDEQACAPLDDGPAIPDRAAPQPPVHQELTTAIGQAEAAFREARELLAADRPYEAREKLEQLPGRLEELRDAAERVAEEGPILRVLASVGTQMSAFVHEIRGLLGTTQAVDDALGRLRQAPGFSADQRQQLAAIHASVGDLKRNLERQASYLLDIATPDASRRRSRQRLADRFDAGVRLVQGAAERRSIEIHNDIVSDLKSPPMFPAELTTVFSNLLSNAVKAAGAGGKIRGRAQRAGRMVILVVENTGVAVDLADAERWFRPFESTTTQVDSILGQGMGLGLTITRNMLEQYGATIRFVPPSPGYATAVEIALPE
jgi:signal transduction histidine kinase